MSSKEENSEDFCLDYILEFGLWSHLGVCDFGSVAPHIDGVDVGVGFDRPATGL